MKIVRVVQGKVIEVIPKSAVPVSDWYNAQFAAQCVEAPDVVQPNWYYDAITKEFSESPFVDPSPTLEDVVSENKLLKAQLQAQSDRSDFIEDCIAEMAMAVYGEV